MQLSQHSLVALVPEVLGGQVEVQILNKGQVADCVCHQNLHINFPNKETYSALVFDIVELKP